MDVSVKVSKAAGNCVYYVNIATVLCTEAGPLLPQIGYPLRHFNDHDGYIVV